MPLFALPLAETSNATNSRLHLASPSHEKRRRLRTRHSSSDEDSASENGQLFLEPATNPLSLTPDEIAQYQLAGLKLNEDLPRVKDFPHRGLVRRSVEKEEKRSRKGKEKENINGVKTDGESLRKKKGPALRSQHLSVLTAVLQKCLMDGDIPRATRAFAMLIRTQFGGHAVDIRSSGYWGIGAELLVRSINQTNTLADGAEDSDGNEQRVKISRKKRWGTKDGLAKAKDYYEWLILEYPYKRQWDSAVTAIDFWPAMLGCEIYGIQLEHTEDLQKIENEEERDSDDEDGESEHEEASQDDTGDDEFATLQKRKVWRRHRLRKKRWQQKEDVRRTALKASESLAARMDEMMNPPPFSDNHALLRLRGMVALYIADLSVSALPIEEDNESDDQVPLRSLRSGRGKDPESRALHRQLLTDHELGKIKKEEEKVRASKLFERIRQDGGWLPGNLGVSADENEDNSDDGF